MADEDANSLLVINASLWQKLLVAGVVTRSAERVWRLVEPWAWLMARIGLERSAVGFWLRKLDYLLFACFLLARYVLAPCRVFHLNLGGPYIALPLMLLRPDHPTVISITHRELAGHVGVQWALPIYRFALARCTAIDALTEGVQEDLVRRGLSEQKI
ncbi:MAG: hypothetical protein ACREIH_07015, partial [Nitrospiraceae bacterium]